MTHTDALPLIEFKTSKRLVEIAWFPIGYGKQKALIRKANPNLPNTGMIG